jgi:putative oxidoreductase
MASILPYLSLGIRLFVGGYFVYAGIPKIIEPLAFATSIGNYGLLPNAMINAIALVLPWLELLCAIGLMIGWRIKLNAALCAAMLAVFTTAVAYAVIMGLKIDCGCFGSAGGDEVSWIKVGKNMLMLLGLVVVYRYPTSPLAFDGRSKGAER